jgi:hypothetical protein
MRLATLRFVSMSILDTLLRGLVVVPTEDADDNIGGELSILHWVGSLVLGSPGQENRFFPEGLTREARRESERPDSVR